MIMQPELMHYPNVNEVTEHTTTTILLNLSIKPLIQLNAMPRFMQETMTRQEMKDLPDDKTDQIRLMMMPDSRSQYLRDEEINSLMKLLAGTFTLKLLNKFRDGVTQRKMQETYEVWAKQLATCITGCMYMGGTDKKAAQRKRHSSEEGGPAAKKPLAT